MPRKLGIEYPGAMYHVMSRGDRREQIFLDDVDRGKASNRRLVLCGTRLGPNA
jgi:hypothetical protein